jgi:hypothetical protein
VSEVMILLLCLVFNSAPAWLKIFLRQSDVSFVSMCRDELDGGQTKSTPCKGHVLPTASSI